MGQPKRPEQNAKKETTARLLAKRRDHYAGPKAPVFASVAGTELRPGNVYRRVLAPAAVAVGLYVEVEVEVTGKDGQVTTEMRKRSAVSFHTFRHTCASLLFDRGRNIKQVQKWLGHADPGVTLRTYVHLIDEGVGDADFFDAAFSDARSAPEAVPEASTGVAAALAA